jgi:phosphate transport system protein
MSFGAHLMFCAKNLERMGDHATNIAEAVHYMVKGETLLRERPKADFTSMLRVSIGRNMTRSGGSCVYREPVP